jgi:membrane associated rhomboid family serine protease
MVLFPYKADVDLGRWPVMTLIVCAICIWVYSRQAYSEYRYERALVRYCNSNITRDEQLVLRYLTDDKQKHYCQVLLEIRRAPDQKGAILELAQAARPIPFYPNGTDSFDYINRVLGNSYARFDGAVPRNLTDRLHYDPKHPTLLTMLTAAFSHGDWWHLTSNLIFFFAFAASVEVITGYFYYLGFIVFAAIGTHMAYTYSVQGVEGALPTVGLSGVVMAMMAFLATVVPTLSIRCFFWFVVIFRTFRVPAMAIAALYILENIFDFTNRDPDDNINYIAHISGAAIGIAMGLIYRLRHQEYLRDLQPGT